MVFLAEVTAATVGCDSVREAAESIQNFQSTSVSQDTPNIAKRLASTICLIFSVVPGRPHLFRAVFRHVLVRECLDILLGSAHIPFDTSLFQTVSVIIPKSFNLVVLC